MLIVSFVSQKMPLIIPYSGLKSNGVKEDKSIFLHAEFVSVDALCKPFYLPIKDKGGITPPPLVVAVCPLMPHQPSVPPEC